MSNGSDLKNFPGAGARVQTGNRFWAFGQAIIGPLLVVLVTASFGLVVSLRDTTRDNTKAIEGHKKEAHAKHPVEWEELAKLRSEFNTHVAEGKYKHNIIDKALQHEHEEIEKMREFMQKGGRFTKQDGDEIRKRIAALERRMWSCGCTDIGVKKFKPNALGN